MHTSVVRRKGWFSFGLAAVAVLAVSNDQAEAQLLRRARSYSQQGASSQSHQNHRNHRPASVAPNIDAATLEQSIQQALAIAAKDWDTSENRSPWGVMHNILAWGVEGEILVDGQRRNSITCLCENRNLKSVQLLKVVDEKLVPIEGPGLQGHPGQFLAVLAQNRISEKQPIQFDDHEFTLEDLIAFEKNSCDSNVELTFKLLGLCHYCGTQAEWKNEKGESWSIERLLKEELAEPINGVTCGGTHRLMAIGLAVSRRRAESAPMEGVWKTAETYLNDYHEYAFSLFNPDGSFSTEWFERRAVASDPQKRLQTTGHVLEWLVVTVSDSELTSSRVQRSMYYLSRLLQSDIGEAWSVGPRAHAIRAMRLYQQRLKQLEEDLDTMQIAGNSLKEEEDPQESDNAVALAISDLTSPDGNAPQSEVADLADPSPRSDAGSETDGLRVSDSNLSGTHSVLEPLPERH